MQNDGITGKLWSKTIRLGIIDCGDVTELKSGAGFQNADGSTLVAMMRRDAVRAKDYSVAREEESVTVYGSEGEVSTSFFRPAEVRLVHRAREKNLSTARSSACPPAVNSGFCKRTQRRSGFEQHRRDGTGDSARD
jgi:hypothetical protein